MASVGHAREKRPGRWELKVYVGRDPLKPERKVYEYRTVDATSQADADKKLALFYAEVVQGGTPSADITFGELLERWFAIAGPKMVPAGRAETRRLIDSRLSPLRDRSLKEVGGRFGTAILDEFYAALRDRGGVCRLRTKCSTAKCAHGGGAPLAGSSVVRTHVVVRAALQQAVKWGLIDRNPADLAYAGEADAPEVDPPTPDDVERMFKLAQEFCADPRKKKEGDKQDLSFLAFLVLASTTGARKGRGLALHWDDIDFERGLVKYSHVLSMGENGPVRVPAGRGKQNRKGRSVVVPLDPIVLAVMVTHRQDAVERAAAGGVTLGPDSYVFSSDPAGDTPWHPRTISRWFGRLRQEAGLDETRLHDLRHFVISYLLSAGVDLSTVKSLVGHSATSATTLDVYAHAQTDDKRNAVGHLARLLNLAPVDPEPEDQPPNVVPIRRPQAG